MSTTYPQVTIPNTEVRMLSSSHADQEFKIKVGLPLSYSHTDLTYPVLYVLDPDIAFGTVAETAFLLQLGRELPELLLVGIGYPVESAFGTFGLRCRDLTPTEDNEWLEEFLKHMPVPMESRGTGGADDFLRFVRKELTPFVNANYRADPEDSALLGHSFGGLFALYALFHQPDTFKRYIIGSASTKWDNDVIFGYETDYAANNTDLPAKVFMSIGSLEEEAGQHELESA